MSLWFLLLLMLLSIELTNADIQPLALDHNNDTAHILNGDTSWNDPGSGDTGDEIDIDVDFIIHKDNVSNTTDIYRLLTIGSRESVDTDLSVSTGLPGQKDASTGLPENEDTQNYVSTGLPENEDTQKDLSTGLLESADTDLTASTGLPENENKQLSASTGLPENEDTQKDASISLPENEDTQYDVSTGLPENEDTQYDASTDLLTSEDSHLSASTASTGLPSQSDNQSVFINHTSVLMNDTMYHSFTTQIDYMEFPSNQTTLLNDSAVSPSEFLPTIQFINSELPNIQTTEEDHSGMDEIDIDTVPTIVVDPLLPYVDKGNPGSDKDSKKTTTGDIIVLPNNGTTIFPTTNITSSNTSTTSRSHSDATTHKIIVDKKTTTVKPRYSLPTDRSNSKFEDKSVSTASVDWLPIAIAVVVSGVLFFFVGFYTQKCRQRNKRNVPRSNSYQPSRERNGQKFKATDIMERGEYTQTETIPLTMSENKSMSTFKGRVRQSPINIATSSVNFEEDYNNVKLTFTSEKEQTYMMTNNGKTLKVAVNKDTSLLEGGPLGEKKYQLDHFHFHWGSTDACGSEHTVDEQSYVAEMHLVHWDKENFASFSEAASSDRADALAVIAVFIQIVDEHHQMSLITDNLSSVKYKGDTVELSKDFQPKAILPENFSDYWSYSGSLTTPPYSENVMWIVLKEPIHMSPGQMQDFRELRNHERDEGHGEHTDKKKSTLFISDNFRKVNSLGKIVVCASFK